MHECMLYAFCLTLNDSLHLLSWTAFTNLFRLPRNFYAAVCRTLFRVAAPPSVPRGAPLAGCQRASYHAATAGRLPARLSADCINTGAPRTRRQSTRRRPASYLPLWQMLRVAAWGGPTPPPPPLRSSCDGGKCGYLLL